MLPRTTVVQGVLVRLCPVGCKCKILCVQWWLGRLARWAASFQYKPRQIRDHLWILVTFAKRRCPFIGSVQDFMPFECPFNVRRRAHNGSPKLSKIKVPRFVCVAGTWYYAHLQNLQPMKQQHRNSEDAGKAEPAGPPSPACWHDMVILLSGHGIFNPKNRELLFRSRVCATLLGRTFTMILYFAGMIVEGSWPWLIQICWNNSRVKIERKTHLHQLGHQTIQQFHRFNGRASK